MCKCIVQVPFIRELRICFIDSITKVSYYAFFMRVGRAYIIRDMKFEYKIAFIVTQIYSDKYDDN